MEPTLTLAHGKALAALSALRSPFDRISGAHHLLAEIDDMRRAILSVTRDEVAALRANGTSVAEIVECSSLSEDQLSRMLRDSATPAMAAAVRG